MTTTTISSTITTRQPRRTLRKSAFKSTPNLNSAYNNFPSSPSSPFSASPHVPSVAFSPTKTSAPPPVPRLPRKASLSALRAFSPTKAAAFFPCPSDVASSHVLDSDLSDEYMPLSPPRTMPMPATPGRLPPVVVDDAPLAEGDLVDVPGRMHGTVRYVGPVEGKKGVFAGVELHPDFASRGKNSGDVDGVTYFITTISGAGIFLPAEKAVRRISPIISIGSFPLTPTGLRAATQNSTNTPPNPTPPKFGVSADAKRQPRTSLSRSESPIRRQTPAPASRPSAIGGVAKASTRNVTTPTPNWLAQSVRGTAADASRNRKSDKAANGARSASALGQSMPAYDYDDLMVPGTLQRSRTSGSLGPGSVPAATAVAAAAAGRMRPPSRANDNGDIVERLRSQLEDREQQLMGQARALAEMETSLAEVQVLMENPDALRRRGSADDKNAAQLRGMLREKNEKISMLTAEFDAHRADFRSTIDALETASAETQKLYERRIEDLTLENRELEARGLNDFDVGSVALQLKQLEEVVQELEEGLEDARRGEAEARGEAEFLRGEVERTRAELRREREKTATALSLTGGGKGDASKELEQKDDEIRGLKAIIHSLSRDSVPGAGVSAATAPAGERSPAAHRSGSFGSQLQHGQLQHHHHHHHHQDESFADRLAREKLEHEMAELQSMVDDKSHREEELERELETLRRSSVSNHSSMHRASGATTATTATTSSRRSSVRDSRDTVTMAAATGADSGSGNYASRQSHSPPKRGGSLQPMETMPENDAYSTAATDTSTLWCEMCETGGHDILSCNSFGNNNNNNINNNIINNNNNSDSVKAGNADGGATCGSPPRTRLSASQFTKDGLIPLRLIGGQPHARSDSHGAKPAPLSPLKGPSPSPSPSPPPPPSPSAPSAAIRIIPNPMESGPVAGKESGVVDEAKWCALCERDGHDSVDCPFEDAF